ncbi:MAG: hypothetical protein B7Z07_00755 [Sphingomonadales bacterium 32-67-7]|nr:MAG: hypothetical protein B7Z07_00755 [Sphingomonadales bacterium 32-67-7]
MPPRRNRFALTGRSVQIDPRREAARRDLADVRLADRVFAPHYAAPLIRIAARPTALRTTRDADAEVLATLAIGDRFEALELSGGLAWGSAPDHGLVGYVTAADLGIVA